MYYNRTPLPTALKTVTLTLLFAILVAIAMTPAADNKAFAASSVATTDDQPNEVDREILTKVAKYLNNISSIKSHFIQVDANGNVSSGTMYMKRPSKMRWEYDPPVPVLIVSTGRSITYYDYELEQISTVKLGDSLASFIAKEKIDFNDKTIEVLRASSAEGVISVTIRQRNEPEQGELTIELISNPVELKRLIVKNAQGQYTEITINNAEYNLPLSSKLFQPPRKSFWPERNIINP